VTAETDIQQDLTAAVACQKDGRLSEAMAACRRALTSVPEHVDALHLFGLLKFSAGDLQEGLEYIHKALLKAPNNKSIAENFARVAIHYPTDQSINAFCEYVANLPNTAPELIPTFVIAGHQIAAKLIDAEAWGLVDRLLDILLPHCGENFDQALLLLGVMAKGHGQKPAAQRFRQYIATYPVHPFGQRKITDGKPVALLLGAADADFTLGQGFSVPGGHAGICDLIVHIDAPIKMVLVNSKMDLRKTRNAIKNCDIVINAIADADQLPVSVARANQFTKSLKSKIVNAPADIAENVRDKDWQRFAKHKDILWPRTVRVLPEKFSDKELKSMFATKDWALPLTVRAVGAHGGTGLEKVDDMERLIERLRENSKTEHFVAQWIDFKSDDGWYRKYRVYRIGGRIVPYHLYIDSSWNIHFGARDNMLKHPDMIEEERAVIMRECEDLEEIFAHLLGEISAATGLEYLGCDFSILPDGRPVVFEANACMKPNIGMAAEKFPSNAHAGQALIDAFKELLAS